MTLVNILGNLIEISVSTVLNLIDQSLHNCLVVFLFPSPCGCVCLSVRFNVSSFVFGHCHHLSCVNPLITLSI